MYFLTFRRTYLYQTHSTNTYINMQRHSVQCDIQHRITYRIKKLQPKFLSAKRVFFARFYPFFFRFFLIKSASLVWPCLFCNMRAHGIWICRETRWIWVHCICCRFSPPPSVVSFNNIFCITVTAMLLLLLLLNVLVLLLFTWMSVRDLEQIRIVLFFCAYDRTLNAVDAQRFVYLRNSHIKIKSTQILRVPAKSSPFVSDCPWSIHTMKRAIRKFALL